MLAQITDLTMQQWALFGAILSAVVTLILIAGDLSFSMPKLPKWGFWRRDVTSKTTPESTKKAEEKAEAKKVKADSKAQKAEEKSKIRTKKLEGKAAVKAVKEGEQAKAEKNELKGWYFGPGTVALLIRPALSSFTGVIIATVLYGIDAWSGSNVLSLGTSSALALAFAFWFGEKDKVPEGEEPLSVPESYALMVTFFGARYKIYLTEGDYPWIGRRLLLGRSKRVVEPATDLNGFIFLGELQIVIWDQGSDKKKNPTLSVVARDSSTIFANLLISIKLFDPMEWLNSTDPLLGIAERARSTFRTAAEFFVGKDNPSLKNVLRDLMVGKTFVGSFLQKQIGLAPQGSVVQDVAGVALFEIVKPSSDSSVASANIAAAEKSLTERYKNISPASETAIKGRDGKTHFEDRSIDESLLEVIESAGATLLRVSIGDVTLSEKFAEEANKAASEVLQRAGQLASAATVKESRKILAPTAEEVAAPGYEMATIIAAAQDNKGVKIVYSPGADSLTRAAIAGASQIGNNS